MRGVAVARTAGCGDVTGFYASTPSPERLWTGWCHLPEVDAARLLAHVDRRHLLESAKVDDVHCAGLGADSLLRDEGVAIVARHSRTVHDTSRHWNACQLRPARDIDDRRRLPTLVRGDEQLAVVRHGQVVDTFPCRDAAKQTPACDVDLHDVAALVAGDEEPAPVRRRLCPSR